MNFVANVFKKYMKNDAKEKEDVEKKSEQHQQNVVPQQPSTSHSNLNLSDTEKTDEFDDNFQDAESNQVLPEIQDRLEEPKPKLPSQENEVPTSDLAETSQDARLEENEDSKGTKNECISTSQSSNKVLPSDDDVKCESLKTIENNGTTVMDLKTKDCKLGLENITVEVQDRNKDMKNIDKAQLEETDNTKNDIASQELNNPKTVDILHDVKAGESPVLHVANKVNLEEQLADHFSSSKKLESNENISVDAQNNGNANLEINKLHMKEVQQPILLIETCDERKGSLQDSKQKLENQHHLNIEVDPLSNTETGKVAINQDQITQMEDNKTISNAATNLDTHINKPPIDKNEVSNQCVADVSLENSNSENGNLLTLTLNNDDKLTMEVKESANNSTSEALVQNLRNDFENIKPSTNIESDQTKNLCHTEDNIEGNAQNLRSLKLAAKNENIVLSGTTNVDSNQHQQAVSNEEPNVEFKLAAKTDGPVENYLDKRDITYERQTTKETANKPISPTQEQESNGNFEDVKPSIKVENEEVCDNIETNRQNILPSLNLLPQDHQITNQQQPAEPVNAAVEDTKEVEDLEKNMPRDEIDHTVEESSQLTHMEDSKTISDAGTHLNININKAPIDKIEVSNQCIDVPFGNSNSENGNSLKMTALENYDQLTMEIKDKANNSTLEALVQDLRSDLENIEPSKNIGSDDNVEANTTNVPSLNLAASTENIVLSSTNNVDTKQHQESNVDFKIATKTDVDKGDITYERLATKETVNKSSFPTQEQELNGNSEDIKQSIKIGNEQVSYIGDIFETNPQNILPSLHLLPQDQHITNQQQPAESGNDAVEAANNTENSLDREVIAYGRQDTKEFEELEKNMCIDEVDHTDKLLQQDMVKTVVEEKQQSLERQDTNEFEILENHFKNEKNKCVSESILEELVSASCGTNANQFAELETAIAIRNDESAICLMKQATNQSENLEEQCKEMGNSLMTNEESINTEKETNNLKIKTDINAILQPKSDYGHENKTSEQLVCTATEQNDTVTNNIQNEKESNKANTDRTILDQQDKDASDLLKTAHDQSEHIRSKANDDLRDKVDLVQQQLDSIRKMNRSFKRENKEKEPNIDGKDILTKYKSLAKEYEKSIKKQTDEISTLRNALEMNLKRFTVTEMAFSEVFDKYEKAKYVIAAFGRNEDNLLENINNAEEKLVEIEAKCNSMKQESTERVRCAQDQVNAEKLKYRQELVKLNAQVKMLEIKSSSLEQALEQKTDECAALTALCSDITGRN